MPATRPASTKGCRCDLGNRVNLGRDEMCEPCSERHHMEMCATRKAEDNEAYNTPTRSYININDYVTLYMLQALTKPQIQLERTHDKVETGTVCNLSITEFTLAPAFENRKKVPI